jgi:hypothetical protein
MEKTVCGCAFEPVFSVELRGLKEDLHEVKERVRALENTLARGVLLLVANLAAVVVALARAVL